MFGRTAAPALPPVAGQPAARKPRFTWVSAGVIAGIVGAGVGIASMDSAYTRDAPYRRAQARSVALPAAPDAQARFDPPAPAPLPLVPAMAVPDAGPLKTPVPAVGTRRASEPEHSKQVVQTGQR